MKTQRTYGLLIGLLGLTSAAQAQPWSGGIRFDITTGATKRGNQFSLVNVPYSSNDYSSADADGLRIGGFVRYDRSKWLAQAELTTGGIGLDIRGSASRIGTIDATASGNRTALGLTGGYKPAPWLRLQAGLGLSRIAWGNTRTAELLAQFQDRLGSEDPRAREFTQAYIDAYTGKLAIESSLRTTQLTGHYGVGLDLGGFTIDVSRTEGLTPLLDGVVVNGQQVDARLNYGYTSLNVGYRIFPFKKFLLAPRKSNRAYQKLKSEIPFYKNEFQVGLGLLAEDIGTGLVYENRYTRYLARRFGITGILGAARTAYTRPDDPNRFKTYTAFHGAITARALPLYTRRHQISLSAGLNVLHVTPRYAAGSAYPNVDGQGNTYAITNVYPAKTGVGWQWQFDYQIALTDHIPIGVWLRSVTNPAFSYAYIGIQSGYRF